VVHFTHYTVGHAHLGVYGFATMILFGALYFIVPRLVNREWPHPALIRWHFWLALSGIAIYFLSLTVGGWLEGRAMLDPARSFESVVTTTKPYLLARSVGGTLMLGAHLVFGYHYWRMVRGRGPERAAPAWSEGGVAG
jgi:cytochrome c oxidase cbb3-type subunit 1